MDCTRTSCLSFIFLRDLMKLFQEHSLCGHLLAVWTTGVNWFGNGECWRFYIFVWWCVSHLTPGCNLLIGVKLIHSIRYQNQNAMWTEQLLHFCIWLWGSSSSTFFKCNLYRNSSLLTFVCAHSVCNGCENVEPVGHFVDGLRYYIQVLLAVRIHCNEQLLKFADFCWHFQCLLQWNTL